MTTINAPPPPPALEQLDPTTQTFTHPIKRINDHTDLARFPSTPGYTLITAFIVHLSSSVSPLDPTTSQLRSPEDFITTTPTVTASPAVQGIVKLIASLQTLITSVPPLTGPQRFGNLAYRSWFAQAEEHVKSHAADYLPAHVLPAKNELLYYLIHSFGSSERLDFGTGHELSFAAFLAGIWVLGGFEPGRDERALVFKAFDAYFKLIRTIVTTYSLEPAGSHGVWGLDDHFFLPYVFGSAQLTTYRPVADAKAKGMPPPPEVDLPKPEDVVKRNIVDHHRERSLYFDAIGFIYDVKRGPFWEHSPILYDISGVQKGWGKINEGLLKMYDKEVLGKFPVVQHFYFGSIFRWVEDAEEDAVTPGAEERDESASSDSRSAAAEPMTRAPWAKQTTTAEPTTRAPWATQGAAVEATTRPPSNQAPAVEPMTRAPWATGGGGAGSALAARGADAAGTRAPWARPQ